jgi:hypothetical protein
MIKLQVLLEDIYSEKPEPTGKGPGFQTSKPEIDPETGTSTSYVTYDPDLKKIEQSLRGYVGDIRRYKESDNGEIAKLAITLSEVLRKVATAMGTLSDKVELEKEKYK